MVEIRKWRHETRSGYASDRSLVRSALPDHFVLMQTFDPQQLVVAGAYNMQSLFSIDMPGARFLRNTLLFSVLGLAATLLPYIALTPGFGSILLQGGAPLSRFLRQVATNGLPVVFAVNYAGFFLYALSNARAPSDQVPQFTLLLDIPIRVALFVVLHIIIYVKSADWFGSFGGSRETALSVVAPTLARSAYFENLSGVYLYATLISALPIYVDLIARANWANRMPVRLPGRVGEVLLALIWFALSVVALTVLAAAVTKWQGS